MEDAKVHPSEMVEFATVASSASYPFDPMGMKHTQDRNDFGDTTNSNSYRHEAQLDFDLYGEISTGSQQLPRIGSDAAAANQSEHRMTFRQALRLYPKAIGWSAVISLAIIMEGYDTGLINSFYAFREFLHSYGVPTEDGQFEITTRWQASLSNGAVCGGIIGLFANGILTERFGYKKTMIGALIVLAAFIFLSFFAFNIRLLLVGQILCGLPWGVFSTLTTTYAAEVMPLNLRQYLTSNVNLCWLLEQITALAILRGLINMNSTWSYRIPFALQWVWIAIILTAATFAPESPWWLVRKGRKEEAKRSLLRLTRRNQGFNADNTLAMMEHTNSVEEILRSRDRKEKPSRFSDWSYMECFRGPNLRRTEIACMIFMTQNFCGLPVIGYAAYLYNQIGFDEIRSFDVTIGMHGLAILGGLLSLVLMKYFGRRTLYLTGLCLCFVILIVAGIMGTRPETPAVLWTLAGLIMALIFVFDTTVGPLTYCLVAEVPSTRLRVKTVVLARVAYNVNSIVTNVLMQRMLNPLAWNWRAKSCFFWAGSCMLCIVYCYYRLPETFGLSFHELDILFGKKADARKFGAFQRILERNGYYSFYEDGSRSENGGDGRAASAASVAWH